MRQEDRRVRRTRRMLGEALVVLALEKSYEEVTIRDITERADVGYTTYFRHYQDKEALLIDVFQSLLMELQELRVAPMIKTAPEQNGTHVFQHVQANTDLYRILLSIGGVTSLFKPVMEMAIQEAESLFGQLAESSVPIDIAANHVVSSLFTLVGWWLDNDMPYPPERMGKIYADLIVHPTWQVVLGERVPSS